MLLPFELMALLSYEIDSLVSPTVTECEDITFSPSFVKVEREESELFSSLFDKLQPS